MIEELRAQGMLMVTLGGVHGHMQAAREAHIQRIEHAPLPFHRLAVCGQALAAYLGC